MGVVTEKDISVADHIHWGKCRTCIYRPETQSWSVIHLRGCVIAVLHSLLNTVYIIIIIKWHSVESQSVRSEATLGKDTWNIYCFCVLVCLQFQWQWRCWKEYNKPAHADTRLISLSFLNLSCSLIMWTTAGNILQSRAAPKRVGRVSVQMPGHYL